MAHSRTKRARPDFVGRERELEQLTSALASAARGAGGVYVLRGEAGIGKSRTAAEVAHAARARGFQVGVGHCLEGDAEPAYAAWVRALRDAPAGEMLEPGAASSDARAVPGRAEESEEPEEIDVEGQRDELFRRLESAIRAATRQQPQLIVLEDLHWADLDSIRLLQHLARSLAGCAWMAICTQRDDEPVDERGRRLLAELSRSANQLPLGPFGESEVETLVGHWTEAMPDPELVRAARRRSGGNPLFLSELIALVVSQSGQVTLAAIDSVGIPDALQQLLERRIEKLSRDTEVLLARGAALGDPFEIAELASWTGRRPDAVLAGLAPAERQRLIEPVGDFGDRFRFSHALMRDAMLARVPRSERAALHRELAVMLEAMGRDQTESELARLAEHHRRGLSSGSALRAVECAAAAAELARRHGAPEQAVRHLHLALDSLNGVAAEAAEIERRRGDLVLSLGHALFQTGQRRAALEAYREAAAIAQRLDWSELLARAAIGMVGRDEDTRGVSEEIQRVVARAHARLAPSPTPLRAGILALTSRLASGRGDFERAETLAREALAIAERLRRPEPWASAAHALHSTIAEADGLPERLDLSQRMVEAAQQSVSRRTELRARQLHFTDLLQAGELGPADEELARIERLAREVDHPSFHWHASSLAAGVDLFRGRFASAERRLNESLDWGRRAGMRNAGALFAVQTFHLRELQGRLGELRPGMQEIVEKNPQVRSLPLIIPLAAMQEDNELLARTTFEPLAARDFEDVPRDRDWLPTLTAHARVAAYLGDANRCDVLLEKLRPYANWCITLPDGQYWEGSVAGVLAPLEVVLGKFDEARGHFETALDCARRAGAVPLIAQTLAAFARFESESGRGEAVASAMLEEALALYRSIDVPLFVERTAAALGALGQAGVATGPGESRVAMRAHGLFERRANTWTVVFGSRRAVVEHRKGMSDLARLLEAPGREIHVLDLIGAAQGPGESATPGRDEAGIGRGPSGLAGVDPQAVRQYRTRLSDLRAAREDAVARNDLAALRAIDAEGEWLERELRSAYGLGRDPTSDFAQKARKAVYNRIRSAIAALADAHPELGRHLQHSVRTGVVCAYQPETREEWVVLEGGMEGVGESPKPTGSGRGGGRASGETPLVQKD